MVLRFTTRPPLVAAPPFARAISVIPRSIAAPGQFVTPKSFRAGGVKFTKTQAPTPEEFTSSGGFKLPISITVQSDKQLRAGLSAGSFGPMGSKSRQAITELIISRQPSRAIVAKETTVGGEVIRQVGVTEIAKPPKKKEVVLEFSDRIMGKKTTEAAALFSKVKDKSFLFQMESRPTEVTPLTGPRGQRVDVFGQQSEALEFIEKKTGTPLPKELSFEERKVKALVKEFKVKDRPLFLSIEEITGSATFAAETFEKISPEPLKAPVKAITFGIAAPAGGILDIGAGVAGRIAEKVVPRETFIETPGGPPITRSTIIGAAEFIGAPIFFGKGVKLFKGLLAEKALGQPTTIKQFLASQRGGRGKITIKPEKLIRKEIKFFQKQERIQTKPVKLAQPPKQLFFREFQPFKATAKEARRLEQFAQKELFQKIKLPSKGEAQRIRTEAKRITAENIFGGKKLPKAFEGRLAIQRTREIGRTQRKRIRGGQELLTATERVELRAPRPFFTPRTTFKSTKTLFKQKKLVQEKGSVLKGDIILADTFKSRKLPKFEKEIAKDVSKIEFAGLTKKKITSFPKIRTKTLEISFATPGSALQLGKQAGKKLEILKPRKRLQPIEIVEAKDVSKAFKGSQFDISLKKMDFTLPKIDIALKGQKSKGVAQSSILFKEDSKQKALELFDTRTKAGELTLPIQDKALLTKDFEITFTAAETPTTKPPTAKIQTPKGGGFPFTTKPLNVDIPKLTPPGEPRPPPPKFKPPPAKKITFPKFGKNIEDSILGKKVQGYDAFGKKGKKLIKITEDPLIRNRAFDFLGKKLDNTTGVSGRVLKANKQIRKPLFDSKPDLRKFRAPKGKTKLARDSIVEKRKYRIDTLGEIVGIPFKGAAARKKSFFPKSRLKL